MRFFASRAALIGLLLCGCVGQTGSDGEPDCSPNSPLSGASYDIAKSRFAFGSKPVAKHAPGIVRWTGSDGVVAIFSSGSAMGIMNGGAPESSLPGWSEDESKLTAHVTSYFGSMGVAECQIGGTRATYGGQGPTPGLERAFDAIPILESHAYAHFDVNDQTTLEGLYWPEIPLEVLGAAVAFRDRLADANALAAYKAKLPSNARGKGQVSIHHSSGLSTSPLPFRAAATYDVIESTPQDDGGPLSFDENGQRVTTIW